MAYPIVVRPGQRATADRLNAGFLLGALVFVAYRDSTQAISSNTVGQAADALQWDNVPLDTLGGWDAGTSTRYVPPIAGRYMCAGGASFEPSSGGDMRGASWRQIGEVVPASTTRTLGGFLATATRAPVFNASSLSMVFNGTTDYVELCPFQNTGGTLNTGTGSNRPYINIVYVAPE